jgi:outer membrane protein assembly factor BamB
MKYLLLLTLLAPLASAFTELSAPEGEPLAFPDAAGSGSVTGGTVRVTDDGMVIATDLSASLYDFYGYVRPRYIRVYEGAGGALAYTMDTIGEAENRREPFATDGNHRDYYFTTDGKVFCINGRTGDTYWETDVGSTLLDPPHLSGEYIYAVTGHDFVGLDAGNGDELWRTWYRYRLDTPTAVVGNIIRIGAIDEIEKPKLEPYTKRRDAVFDGLTGDLIAGEYFMKDETPRAAIFESFNSDRTLYADKTEPAIHFAAGLSSRYVFDFAEVVFVESTADRVAAYGRLSGERLWQLDGYTVEDSADNAVLLRGAEGEPEYRCISAEGDDLWVVDIGGLVHCNLENEFTLVKAGGEIKRIAWGNNPGWNVAGNVELFYGVDSSRLFYNDGHNIVARDSVIGEKLWEMGLSMRANYVKIIAGVPVVCNAFFIYALDPETGGELWRIKNERSFATKKNYQDSPYTHSVCGNTLFVMHSKDVITAIEVTVGEVLWHRRYDFRADLIERTHSSKGLLTLEGNDGYYYIVDMEDGRPVCKYHCEMMGDVWPRRQPVGFTAGADPYAIWYGFELP